MPDFLPTDVCPLVTPYTRKIGIPDETLEKLLRVRQWDIENGPPIPFKWPTHLRHTIWDTIHSCDSGVPLEVRQYQLQQVHNMVRLRRYINGDSVGLGKTLDAIIACAWLFDRAPKTKVILFCTKSTFLQWPDEYKRFSTLRAEVLTDTYNKKKSYPAHFEQLKDFLENDNADVLVCRYTSLIGKRKKVAGKFDSSGRPARGGVEAISDEIREFTNILRPHGERIIFITDECQKYKTAGLTLNILVQMVQKPCAYAWPMSATAIKNNLLEFYTIASANGIRPFGTIAEFEDEFCIYRDVHVGNGVYKRTLDGYRNVARFKAGMRPFFMGRSQRQVKEKMPRLTTIIHPIDMDADQKRLLLRDIPSGAYKLPPRVFKAHGEWIEKDRDPENMMTQLAVYRQVANSVALLDPTDPKQFLSKKLSPKEECLLDLLDGDLRGEKAIVFTCFKRHIDRLEALTNARQFTDRKFLRITGAENVNQREAAKKAFQDPTGDNDIIFINTAAIEGVNLQQASHMVCLDLPWSWGDLLQLVGRMVRMASPHSACTLHILVARGSIDEFTMETLRGKKDIFEKILGESHSAGILDSKESYDLDAGMEQIGSDAEFRSMMKAHAKSIGMKVFLAGDQLREADSNEGYKMVFEPGGNKPAPSRTYLEEIDDTESLWS